MLIDFFNILVSSSMDYNPACPRITNKTMTIQPWLKSNTDCRLEEEACRKISLVREFEKDVPAVIIIHDLENQSVVYMSERGREYLGMSLEEVRLPFSEYHSRYFNEEDAQYYVPKILELVRQNEQDNMISYFQQVRRSPDHPWIWHMSSTKIFLREANGNPRLIITLAVPVDSEHPIAVKVEKVLEENKFLRANHHIFASLTRREKEILKNMALGKSSLDIANELHISETTANTHRRNIRKKINAGNIYEITRFAQAFDLI